jgi:hypothetical protein
MWLASGGPATVLLAGAATNSTLAGGSAAALGPLAWVVGRRPVPWLGQPQRAK